MAEINCAILVGRLTRDAEIKYAQSGMAIVNFSLAINRRIKKGDQWTDEANFFDITIFGKMGEAVQKFLTKGKTVGVQGELKQDRYEKDGQKHSKVHIICQTLQLLGGKENGTAPVQTFQADTHDSDVFQDDIPF